MNKAQLISKINTLAAQRDALDKPIRELRGRVLRLESGIDLYGNIGGLKAELKDLCKQADDLNNARNEAVRELIRLENSKAAELHTTANETDLTPEQAATVASLIDDWSERAVPTMQFLTVGFTKKAAGFHVAVNKRIILQYFIDCDGTVIRSLDYGVLDMPVFFDHAERLNQPLSWFK